MLHSVTDTVIVLATLHLCGFHFYASSIPRSGFLSCTSNHFLVQVVCRGKRKSMKGVKMAFIPGFYWV